MPSAKSRSTAKDAIEAARAAYDKLTDEQKKLVPNYETLTKAEETYAALADAAAVKEVEDLIDAIGTVDENNKDAIEAARAAYDALPTRLQPEVSNYDKLVKAGKDYADLLTAVEAAQKAAGMPARHSRTPRLRRRGRSREGCRRGPQKAAEEAARLPAKTAGRQKAQAAAEEAQAKAEAAQAAAEAQASAEAAQKAAGTPLPLPPANNALAAEAAAKAAEEAAKSR